MSLALEAFFVAYGVSAGAAMLALHRSAPAGEPLRDRIAGQGWMLVWPLALALILLLDGLDARRQRRARRVRL